MVRIRMVLLILLGCTMAYGQFNMDSPVTVNIRLKSVSKEFVEVEAQMDMEEEVHVYSSTKRFFSILDVKSVGLGQRQLILPKSKKYKDIDGSMVDVYADKTVIIIKKAYTGKTGEKWEYSGTLSYQACDNSVCYPPKTVKFQFQGTIPQGAKIQQTVAKIDKKPQQQPNKDTVKAQNWQALVKNFTVVGRKVGYMNSEVFLTFVSGVGKEDSNSDTGLAGKSIWLVIGIILLGGIALNLTPCVLPLIPINIAILGAGAQAGSRARGFALGAVYGLGMALSYGILGVFVVLTGSKFGTINSYPWFNFAIAGLFVILSLAMFDVLMIDFSKWRKPKKMDEKKRGKFLTAFVMGSIAALLAGACVAPVLISVLLYANGLYAAGNQAGLLLPFLLGVGMALPWPLAGASLSFLPKPGNWMNKIKYVFGVFIFAMALYYGYLGVTLLKSPAIVKHEGWHTSLEEGLKEAKAKEKPVLIDFWATWCKNCLTMEKTTLKDPKVKKYLQNFVKIKYQAEKPNKMPAKAVMDYFKALGLPTYIILKVKK